MNGLGKKIADGVIAWAIPIVCAGLIALWGRAPEEVRHYWPVAIMCVVGVLSIAISMQNRQEIRKMREIHESAAALEENNRKAFLAILDDSMGSIYAACVARGYSTEDERRRYTRLDAAYKGQGGNGEATRRKEHFNALPDEEEWHAQNDRNKGG